MHSTRVVALHQELGVIIYWVLVEVMEFSVAIRSIRLEAVVQHNLGQVIPTLAVKVVQHLVGHFLQIMLHSILVQVVVVVEILVVVALVVVVLYLLSMMHISPMHQVYLVTYYMLIKVDIAFSIG
jgi:hypothetical protein